MMRKLCVLRRCASPFLPWRETVYYLGNRFHETALARRRREPGARFWYLSGAEASE